MITRWRDIEIDYKGGTRHGAGMQRGTTGDGFNNAACRGKWCVIHGRRRVGVLPSVVKYTVAPHVAVVSDTVCYLSNVAPLDDMETVAATG